MTPRTDMQQVFTLRPQLKPHFEHGRPLVGFADFPTTPRGRVWVQRGLPERKPYPMWPDIDATMAHEGLAYRRFEGVIVLAGIGLGYLAEGIARRLGPFATLAIWEPDPEWLRAACYLRDNTALLMNPQVQLVLGNEDALKGYIDHLYRNMALQVCPIIDSCLADLYPKLREVMDDVLPPLIMGYDGNRATLLAFHRLFFQNTIQSLKHLPVATPVMALKGIATGIPAIIVGAGPSLAKHYETLRAQATQHPNSTILFAADTALKPLLDQQVFPDFVVSVDPQQDTASKYWHIDQTHFKGERLSLIYHPGANAAIPDLQFTRKFYCASGLSPLDRFLDLTGQSQGVGDAIQCQVHLAADVATFMGCSPIILVGLDLCYYGVEGMYVENPPQLEGHEQEVFDRGMPETDRDGHPVTVTTQFLQYRHGFATRGQSAHYYNCNEQGLTIPNIENRPLAAVLADYGGLRTIKLRQVLEQIMAKTPTVDAAILRKRLRRFCLDLRFYELVAKQVVARLPLGDTPENRDILNRWCTKVIQRKAGLRVLSVLQGYGQVLPPPMKRCRLPSLHDQVQGHMEWVQVKAYYEWLFEAAKAAREECEGVYERLKGLSLSSEI